MDDSSGDDVPLVQRRAFRQALRLSQGDVEPSSRENSPLPAWISQHGTPSKVDLVKEDSSASSSGDEKILVESRNFANQRPKAASPKTRGKADKTAKPQQLQGVVSRSINQSRKNCILGPRGHRCAGCLCLTYSLLSQRRNTGVRSSTGSVILKSLQLESLVPETQMMDGRRYWCNTG